MPIARTTDPRKVSTGQRSELEKFANDMQSYQDAPIVPVFTVATAPDGEAGQLGYVTDGNAGEACLAVHDGTDWKVVALGATIAAS